MDLKSAEMINEPRICPTSDMEYPSRGVESSQSISETKPLGKKSYGPNYVKSKLVLSVVLHRAKS